MKSSLAALLLLSVATLSCKKSDDSTNNNPGGGGGATERSWKVGGTTYTVNNYSRSSETFSAYDKEGNSISFTFASYPPPAGSYRVVANNATPGASEVQVYTGSFGSNADTYFATGSGNTSATISFDDTRIEIVLPDTWAKKAGGSDSVRISATLSPL